MLTTSAYFGAITRDYSLSLARTAASSTISRQTKYYMANIGKVKTVDDLLKNDKLYTYVMKAFGLDDMINAKGLIAKVLNGGVASSKSLANTLHDARYKALASAFDFATFGTATTSQTTATQGTVDKYIEIALETDAGKQNEGTRKALYFQRMAPKLTSLYGILADKTLLSVVQTAFGLDPSMSKLNIDVQVKLMETHLKVGDLQNPAKLAKIIGRFTANYDSKNLATAPATPISALFAPTTGINSNLLLALANLKLGGS